ncbi:MAG TPA: hypothetical protein VFX58_07895 [Chitinophagaceae bacterium]|nr:hypothetical protein [Chitinophagaceae bacterium]
MKQIAAITALFAALSIVGCGTKSSNNSTSNVPVPAGKPVLPTFNSGTGQPAGNATGTQTMSSAPATTASVTLNPEHGQPGHRCDIAVGAPLNNAPATTATTSTNPTTVTAPATTQVQPVQPVATTATPATTAKGLNPAHGQPGHRCDIAVGAPLDSKPINVTANQTTTTTTPAQNPVTPMQVTPILPASNNNNATAPANAETKTAAGLNPAHGQPGHRCDLAVGAPLPADSGKKQ